MPPSPPLSLPSPHRPAIISPSSPVPAVAAQQTPAQRGGTKRGGTAATLLRVAPPTACATSVRASDGEISRGGHPTMAPISRCAPPTARGSAWSPNDGPMSRRTTRSDLRRRDRDAPTSRRTTRSPPPSIAAWWPSRQARDQRRWLLHQARKQSRRIHDDCDTYPLCRISRRSGELARRRGGG